MYFWSNSTYNFYFHRKFQRIFFKNIAKKKKLYIYQKNSFYIAFNHSPQEKCVTNNCKDSLSPHQRRHRLVKVLPRRLCRPHPNDSVHKIFIHAAVDTSRTSHKSLLHHLHASMVSVSLYCTLNFIQLQTSYGP